MFDRRPHYSPAGAALFSLLHEAAETSLHGPFRGQDALLDLLAHGTPRTVAELARARGQTRQAVQRVARDLVERGFAVFEANPRHRRAPLLCATEAGRRRQQVLAADRAAALNAAARAFDPTELRRAARLLSTARRVLTRA